MQVRSPPIKTPRKSVLHYYGVEELLRIRPIDNKLTNLAGERIQNDHQVKHIPNKPGVYFIATNEPVIHSMHKNKLPEKLGSYEIVYNGTTCDLRNRIRSHLVRTKHKGMSGISVDLLTTDEDASSHTKVVCCKSPHKKKVPYDSNGEKLGIETLPLQMHLSSTEKQFIKKFEDSSIVYFQNGINISNDKHKCWEWVVFFQEIDSQEVRCIVENSWRKMYGMPRLCSYIDGR